MQIRDMDEADTKAKALLDKQALDKAAEGG